MKFVNMTKMTFFAISEALKFEFSRQKDMKFVNLTKMTFLAISETLKFVFSRQNDMEFVNICKVIAEFLSQIKLETNFLENVTFQRHQM